MVLDNVVPVRLPTDKGEQKRQGQRSSHLSHNPGTYFDIGRFTQAGKQLCPEFSTVLDPSLVTAMEDSPLDDIEYTYHGKTGAELSWLYL